jgi:hypothetical protein
MRFSRVRLEGGEVMKLPISGIIVLLALALSSAIPAAAAAPDIAWTLGPTLPTPLARFDGEIVGNRIYFLGGRTNTPPPTDTVGNTVGGPAGDTVTQTGNSVGSTVDNTTKAAGDLLGQP